jgi:holo-[acyl-carrier protein] synthase
MIAGIGTDIVQINRLNEQLAIKILAKEEIELFHGFLAPSRKQEFLAGRFAAKEALIKALGARQPGLGFVDIAILNDDSGKPRVVKPELAGLKVWLSLAHERDYAVAVCVLETTE